MSTNNTCGCQAESETKPIQAGVTYRPDIDICETADAFVVTADIPGATAETIDVNVDQGVLTLRASVPARGPSGTGGARRLVREYGVGDFERAIRVGEGIDTERIGAEFKNGVLTLHVPKSSQARARKIPVHGA